MRYRLTALLVLLLALSAMGAAKKKRHVSTLVQATNLTYRGSFTVPDVFAYGGGALGLNPVNHSLWLSVGQSLGEISIPALGERALLIQAPTDPAEGMHVGATDERIGGTLSLYGQLSFTKYIYYDADSVQRQSHFLRSSDLGAVSVLGPYAVGPLNPGFYSGYLASVPWNLQGLLGAPALTGNCCLNIITRTSFGPAAFAFDPETFTTQPLVYYPQDHPTLGPWSGASAYFGGSDRITGLVVPDGFESVLFFGRHGTTFCYGTGADCGDPTDPYQGVHGYPYLSQVWAYDANQLAAVRLGTIAPWDVRPSAVWTLKELNGSLIGGAAYDPLGLIYVSQLKGDGDRPRIYVYEVR